MLNMYILSKVIMENILIYNIEHLWDFLLNIYIIQLCVLLYVI